MKTKHVHNFETKRENATVLICECGRFQNVISESNPAIVEMKPQPQHTPGPFPTYNLHNYTMEKVTPSYFKLFDAAPELLETLKELIKQVEEHSISHDRIPLNAVYMNAARSVIAKAEGRE